VPASTGVSRVRAWDPANRDRGAVLGNAGQVRRRVGLRLSAAGSTANLVNSEGCSYNSPAGSTGARGEWCWPASAVSSEATPAKTQHDREDRAARYVSLRMVVGLSNRS
jgi:hypothetical protein